MDADNFKAWRYAVGLTQDAASTLLGVSRVTIQNWENSVTQIPPSIVAACYTHARRFKMQLDYGPVTLVYYDAPLWQKTYGPVVVPKLFRELYPDNQSAISRLRELIEQNQEVHNPLLVDETGDTVWSSAELLNECKHHELNYSKSQMPVPWHKIIIRDSDVAELSANSLMNKFGVKYRAAFIPKVAQVYREETDNGDFVFYFSPVACAIAPDLMRTFHAVACTDKPDLSRSRKLGL